MKVADPLVELLAIKLYEHDSTDGHFRARGTTMTNWSSLADADREVYRAIARGERDYGQEPPKIRKKRQ